MEFKIGDKVKLGATLTRNYGATRKDLAEVKCVRTGGDIYLIWLTKTTQIDGIYRQNDFIKCLENCKGCENRLHCITQ